MPATKQAESRGQLIGLGILSIIIVFVAVWLQIQDKGAVSQSSATFKPIADKDLARFLADAWYLPNEPLLGFVEIPAGPFVMASDPKADPMAFANEKWSAASNQGTVTIPAFYIGRYEVTVAEFRSFVATTGFKANQSLQ
jgi:formylglycine-generating enzyme required for sulfatase activity